MGNLPGSRPHRFSARTAVFLELLGVLALAWPARAIARTQLYDYGHRLDRTLPKEHESASPEIQLLVPIVFYGETYNSIFVNANGLLSFLTDIRSFFNVQFPLDYPVIAPLYTNVDTRGSGTVFYRETQDKQILEKSTINIKHAFTSGEEFSAKSVFIATWENVGYYKLGQDKVNTYQVVISSNGTDSYAEFLYADNGIQWIQGTSQESGLPDARAQAGMVSGDGRLYTLQGSGSDQSQFLDRWSNTGNPGEWLFRIGQTGQTGNVKLPDVTGEEEMPLLETCASRGATACHSKARCTDHYPGFCCHCQPDHYGNGISCLPDDIPLRVNGKLSGSINDIELENLDIQSYVVTPDGRTYTAISRVPENIGYDMQILNIIGGVIGWLFARPLNNVANGYHVTGGVFNHTAKLSFPQSGHKLTLRQRYEGLDVFDQLRLHAEIQGSVPVIPLGTGIRMSQYEEQYTRTAPGTIVSRASQTFQLEGTHVDNPFEVEQIIHYEECPHGRSNITTLHLKVARNLITYEAREKIIRFGMTSKILPPGEFDPCQEGHKSCVEYSSCIVEGDTFRCVCNPGYQYLYLDVSPDGAAACVDINECTSGIHDCNINALCVNEEGSYSCRCNAGYKGDGRTCRLLDCEDTQCHPNARCKETYPGHSQCQCLDGYVGNGLHCEPSRSDECNVANNCSPFAICQFNELTRVYTCECLPGHHGDGYSCVETGSITPDCTEGECWCPHDFELEGLMCIRKNDSLVHETNTQLSCNIINTCHPHAQCVYSALHGSYQCQCNAGYEGDGYDCNELDVSCLEVDICDIHASCQYDDSRGKHICQCNTGYRMDGGYCSPIHECQTDSDCDYNAICSWSYQFNHYQCICKEGYTLQDGACQPLQGSSCKLINDCHHNALCLYNAQSSNYVCKCNPGYSGDGKTCEPDPIGCNILHNCGPSAECVYDQQAAGYRCRCRQGFRGNGTLCAPKTSCKDNPQLCSTDATCVADSQGLYVCQCKSGFVGNGNVCKQISKTEENFLLLNQGMATLRIPISTVSKEKSRPITIKPFQEAVGIDVDCMEGRVYWSDITGKVMRSAFYDGTNVTSFLQSDLGSLEGLSVDWVSRNIYWTDSAKDTIEVANLDSKLRKVLVSDGLVNPRGIAVHPGRGKLFWSDWNRKAPKLESASLDGSKRATLPTGSLVSLPNSLAIDWDNDELCWADAGTHAIACIGIGSFSTRTVVAGVSHPFGLAISHSNYYWTDWNTHKVESAQKPFGQKNQPISVPLGGIGKLYGIVVVQKCKELSNACRFQNGHCPEGFICLPNDFGGRSCACADADEEGSGETQSCNDINEK